MVLLGAGVADACLPGLWGAAGVCNDHGKTYALYAITVFKRNQDGSEDCWKTYRRYSDFHDFHMRITEQVRACARAVSVVFIAEIHSFSLAQPGYVLFVALKKAFTITGHMTMKHLPTPVKAIQF